MFPMRSWCFVRVRSNKFNNLANKHLAPKAEVTGSNPVGCANKPLKKNSYFVLPVSVDA